MMPSNPRFKNQPRNTQECLTSGKLWHLFTMKEEVITTS